MIGQGKSPGTHRGRGAELNRVGEDDAGPAELTIARPDGARRMPTADIHVEGAQDEWRTPCGARAEGQHQFKVELRRSGTAGGGCDEN